MNGRAHKLRILQTRSQDYMIEVEVEADTYEEAIKKFKRGLVVLPVRTDPRWKAGAGWIEDECVVSPED